MWVVNESQQETIVTPGQVVAAAEEVPIVNVVRPEAGKKVHINERLSEEQQKEIGTMKLTVDYRKIE